MWEEREEAEGQDDYLSERRLYVLFSRGSEPRRAFGPFRAVQVTADSVWAFEGSEPLQIAVKGADGLWAIPDGSDQPTRFRHVLMLCPPRGLSAAQIEEHLSPRSRD